MLTRRQFLNYGTLAAAGALAPRLASSDAAAPSFHFPSAPRDRIAVATYPFRDFIVDPSQPSPSGPARIELKDFAAHVIGKFNVNKIEPWSAHFPSLDPKYLEQLRSSIEKAHASVANVAVDGEHSPYSSDSAEREQAVAYGRKFVDVAVAIGSRSIRTNLPAAKDSRPHLERAAASMSRIAEYAASKNVVVSMENDNPESEDPFFLVSIIEKVNSPWLRALPDFANTLARFDAPYAYRGLDAMFAHACCICHVKSAENNAQGKLVQVDMPKAFGILKRHDYKGYCSMEWDSPGDAYAGTAGLIEQTLRYLG